MQISDWLNLNTVSLTKSGSSSPRLDAEIILAQALNQTRTWLHAHNDEALSQDQLDQANQLVARRLQNEPIAYIIGSREFFGRDFIVSPATLIPRPESEAIIELLAEFSTPNHHNLVDIGTGSGCLGITAKLEHPELNVTLVDISPEALEIAQQNAKKLLVEVQILKSNLLTDTPTNYDIILANLPYVDPEWKRSPETDYEPKLALFADQAGLDLIFQLIDQTSTKLNQSGLLILEADPVQHPAIIQKVQANSLKLLKTSGYALAFAKI